MEAFLSMSIRSACFIDEALFLVKSKTSRSWDYSSQVLDYQDFWIIGCQIKGVLIY